MQTERRFLIAPPLGRLIRRDRGVATRTVEGHFPARADRIQFVRVERDQALLVLRTRGDDGQVRDEQIELPLAHAEALLDVGAGTVAFDQTELQVGPGATGLLQGFILPSGLDLLTVTVTSDPRLFVPPLWVGLEVTTHPGFDIRQLALNGPPQIEEPQISNAILDALLDWLEGRHSHGERAPAADAAADDPTHVIDPAYETQPDTPLRSERVRSVSTLIIEGEAIPAPAGPLQEALSGRPKPENPAEGNGEADGADRAQKEKVEVVSSSPPELGGSRPPTWRGEAPEMEEGIARLARSLAPRRSRSG